MTGRRTPPNSLRTFTAGFVLLVVIATGCTSATPDAQTAANDSRSTEADKTPAPLEVVYRSEQVSCDGEQHDVAEVRGAEPGEVLAFESALPIALPDAVADQEGNHTVRWSCSQDEARLRWSLTATGLSSGREATVSFRGADVTPDVGAITFVPAETPFVCDGLMKPLGTLSGGVPDEQVEVVSSWTGRSAHRFDGLGEAPLWWTCGPDDAATWQVRVETEDPDRSMTFDVTGVPVDPADLPELSVVVSENPFVCNGESRQFATISDLYPFEDVSFTEATGADIVGGKADGDGNLPIRWQCGLNDEPRNVELTATGAATGRSITIDFSTVAPDPGTVSPLSVTVTEEPFVCDGRSRAFAIIVGLAPNEFVRFTSPQAENLREGQADSSGDLPIRWRCETDDIGTVWEVTASGRTSGKSTTIVITGAAPE